MDESVARFQRDALARIESFRNWKSTRSRPMPCSPNSDLLNDLAAVAAGTKPVALLSHFTPQKPEFPFLCATALKRPDHIYLTIANHAYDPDVTTSHIIGHKDSANAVYKLLHDKEEFYRLNPHLERKPNKAFDRLLGAALGICPEAIADFITLNSERYEYFEPYGELLKQFSGCTPRPRLQAGVRNSAIASGIELTPARSH